MQPGLPPPPPLQDVYSSMRALLRVGDFAMAFSQALQDPSTVVWVCNQVEPGAVLDDQPCMLDQASLRTDAGMGVGVGGGGVSEWLAACCAAGCRVSACSLERQPRSSDGNWGWGIRRMV